MSRYARLFTIAITVCALLSLGAATSTAQTAIEELATEQISQETGIDEDELATLFVSDDGDRFIIAFVFISESTLQSDLKPHLKEAVAPFVGRNAMLTMVVPQSQVSFSPTEIAFAQENTTHLLAINQIHAIDESFISGQLPGGNVSSGIIELPRTLDFEAQFDIVFRGEFSTPFFIGHEVVVEDSEEQSNSESPPNFLLAFLQFLLTIILIPFLII